MEYRALVDKGTDGPPWGLLRIDLNHEKKQLTVEIATKAQPSWRQESDAYRFIYDGDDSSRADTLTEEQAITFLEDWKASV